MKKLFLILVLALSVLVLSPVAYAASEYAGGVADAPLNPCSLSVSAEDFRLNYYSRNGDYDCAHPGPATSVDAIYCDPTAGSIITAHPSGILASCAFNQAWADDCVNNIGGEVIMNSGCTFDENTYMWSICNFGSGCSSWRDNFAGAWDAASCIGSAPAHDSRCWIDNGDGTYHQNWIKRCTAANQPTCCLRQTVYRDADGDGWGNPSSTAYRCPSLAAGYVTTSGDCNDANATINPGHAELFNGVDDNCNGQIDEGLGRCVPFGTPDTYLVPSGGFTTNKVEASGKLSADGKFACVEDGRQFGMSFSHATLRTDLSCGAGYVCIQANTNYQLGYANHYIYYCAYTNVECTQDNPDVSSYSKDCEGQVDTRCVPTNGDYFDGYPTAVGTGQSCAPNSVTDTFGKNVHINYACDANPSLPCYNYFCGSGNYAYSCGSGYANQGTACLAQTAVAAGICDTTSRCQDSSTDNTIVCAKQDNKGTAVVSHCCSNGYWNGVGCTGFALCPVGCTYNPLDITSIRTFLNQPSGTCTDKAVKEACAHYDITGLGTTFNKLLSRAYIIHQPSGGEAGKTS